MSRDLTLDNLIAIILDMNGIPEEPIDEYMFLEGDLGIYGDDSDELLLEIERIFSVKFTRDILGLEENQYLAHSEPTLLTLLAPFFWLSRKLFGKGYFENVKNITVGQLYEATVKAKQRASCG